jgi:hypothetical protein
MKSSKELKKAPLMFDSLNYARSANIILAVLGNPEAVIGFTELPGKEIPESTFRMSMEEQRLIKSAKY